MSPDPRTAFIHESIRQLVRAKAEIEERAAEIAFSRWGLRACTTAWPCGHIAYVDDSHGYTHPHHCPTCDGRRAPGCDVEYVIPKYGYVP